MEFGRRHVVMSDPEHYEVCYTINPWMKPDAWASDREAGRRLARAQWSALAEQLRQLGLTVEVVPALAGSPDLVFPANAAVVLDGRALVARFRHSERRGEEAHFLAFFQNLVTAGLLAEVRQIPAGMFQEGAGDCLWDDSRQQFWAAHGPRSSPAAVREIGAYFGQPVVALELATERFYHLDTCFCVLPGGEVLYYPPAFSPSAQATIAERVPRGLLIAATDDEAAAFSLNAVGMGRDLVMTEPPPRLRGLIEERGYTCRPVELSSFVMSGGAAFCMTLRLDLASRAHQSAAAE